MPESAEEIYARVMAQVGESGRLPMPPSGEWDIFPWESVDGVLAPKVLRPPAAAEHERNGEGDKPCWRCEHEDANVIWRNQQWLVASSAAPTGLLSLTLESRTHMDFLDMDDELASEFGRTANNLHRILHYLPNVGRVHISKWGDGSAHLHVWFIARPERFEQILGSPAAEWNDILPPMPEQTWRADLAEVARKLATHDGKALV